MDFGTVVNRDTLTERIFLVKVAYPRDMANHITAYSIYNMLCGGKNFVECDAKEVVVNHCGMSKAAIVREV